MTLTRRTVLLLCATLPRRADFPPALSSAEWAAHASGREVAGGTERIEALLARSTKLDAALEALRIRGVWTMTILDPDYPAGLRRLGPLAPPILYGLGNRARLEQKALGLVAAGSAPLSTFDDAKRLGERTAASGVVLAAGASQAIEVEALTAAIEAHGTALAWAPDRLLERGTGAVWKRALETRRMALISARAPDAKALPGAEGRHQLYMAAAASALLVLTAKADRRALEGVTETLRASLSPLMLAPAFAGSQLGRGLASWGAYAPEADVWERFTNPASEPDPVAVFFERPHAPVTSPELFELEPDPTLDFTADGLAAEEAPKCEPEKRPVPETTAEENIAKKPQALQTQDAASANEAVEAPETVEPPSGKPAEPPAETLEIQLAASEEKSEAKVPEAVETVASSEAKTEVKQPAAVAVPAPAPRLEPAPEPEPEAKKEAKAEPSAKKTTEESKTDDAEGKTVKPARTVSLDTTAFYELFLQHWATLGPDSVTEDEITERLGLHKKQAVAWLKTACALGDAVQVGRSPKRYRREESLFGAPQSASFKPEPMLERFFESLPKGQPIGREALLELTGLESVQIRDWMKLLVDTARVAKRRSPVAYVRL